MPTARDEGYEKFIVCPYDRSHQIRAGRMQFHLRKCRMNHPNSQLVQCPFNANHLIPKAEEEYHMEEECPNRTIWETAFHQVGDTPCPVRDLVKVNAASVPDGGENWEDCDIRGSVLENIKKNVENKEIIRMAQCVPKSEKKLFRKHERERHNQLRSEGPKNSSDDPNDSFFASHMESLPKPPTKTSNVPIDKQDPAVAMAALNKQLGSLELSGNNKKKLTATSNAAAVSTSSAAAVNSNGAGPVKQSNEPSTSRQAPQSYAAISSKSVDKNTRPPSSLSSQTAVNGSVSLMTALNSSSSSMVTAQSYVNRHPPSASSNASSVNRTIPSPDEDGFCTVPIPGLGRGRRRSNYVN